MRTSKTGKQTYKADFHMSSCQNTNQSGSSLESLQPIQQQVIKKNLLFPLTTLGRKELLLEANKWCAVYR